MGWCVIFTHIPRAELYCHLWGEKALYANRIINLSERKDSERNRYQGVEARQSQIKSQTCPCKHQERWNEWTRYWRMEEYHVLNVLWSVWLPFFAIFFSEAGLFLEDTHYRKPLRSLQRREKLRKRQQVCSTVGGRRTNLLAFFLMAAGLCLRAD